MNTKLNLNDPQEFEKFSQSLFNQEQFSFKKEEAMAFNQFYENKWIGFPHYAKKLASEWVHTTGFLDELHSRLEKSNTLEEATENTLNQFKLWGKQVVADFVGALCLLETKVTTLNDNDSMIDIIRNHDRSYGGYLKEIAQDFDLSLAEPLAMIKPLHDNAIGFVQWMFSVVEVGLINRRELIKDALSSDSYDELMLKLMVSTKDVFEDSALLCGFVAKKLALNDFYEKNPAIN